MADQKVVTIRLLTFHANNATRGLWARYSLRPAPLRHRNSEAVQTSRVSSLPLCLAALSSSVGGTVLASYATGVPQIGD